MLFDDLSEESFRDALKNECSLKKKSKEISYGIIQQEYTICEFLEKLGFALTSPDLETRLKSVSLFSSTLSNLPLNFLPQCQLEYIFDFFCDRLKDHHSLVPTLLDGIIILESMNIPAGSTTKFFHNLFLHVCCQSQTREDREKIFKILKIAADSHSEELKAMGVDFVYGVITLIDGERDPRNLNFLFSFMPTFLQRFPLYHLSEEIFEVFACYFPIDFQPMKNETSISRNSLASKLADCLVASCDFVDWTIAVILDKLESDFKVAKYDSLDLLTKSADKFPAKLIEPHFGKIWKALKLVIFPGTDDQDLSLCGLNTLEQVLTHIAADEAISRNFQTVILCTILPHLSDAHHKLFKPASAIAIICVKGDPLFSSDKILECFLLKIIAEQYDNEKSLAMLKVIIEILKVCNERNILQNMNLALLEKIQEVPMRFLLESETKVDCIEITLIYLSEIMNIIIIERRNTIYTFLQKILIDNKYQLDLRNFLSNICKYYSAELHDKCISSIIESYNDHSTCVKQNILLNISILIKSEFFKSIILTFFFKCIFEPLNVETQVITLQALRAFLEKKSDIHFIRELYVTHNFLDKLVHIIRKDNFPYFVLENISAIISLIVRSLNKDDQRIIFDKYLTNGSLNVASELYLVNGIVSYIHTDINIDSKYEKLLNELTEISIRSENEILRQVSQQLICSLLNKAIRNANNDIIIEKIITSLEEEIRDRNKNAVEALAWICKALLAQGYPRLNNIIAPMIHLLDHPQLFEQAVLGFEIISADFPGPHLIVTKVLFKQRLFNTVLMALDEKLKKFSEPHVKAFIYIVKTTPQSILKMNVYKVAPVLFRCLESEKLVSSGIPLEVLKRFLSAKHEYFQSHIGQLISHFLRLTSVKDSMNNRILALECLEAVTKYPTFILMPFKTDVIHGLVPAIDDNKRFVRRAAVNVRNTWFLIGC